ncbi:MAG: hypothetical protein EZS28_006725 [Streblomastix strix]|uniref:protein-tyrosine-phosphatase n=1 Tax=Streblomastix strix TaxID=222440 RepID=A0A5J4WRJ2_9EUKA|nr:MAG: hypothetical protein EZS28_006725 [Streblomastix strix]
MVNIIRELQITHVLNCADDFAPGSDGKSLMEYKVPEGVIVHHMDMEDGDEQQINFSESYQFIDDALNGCQKQSPQQSSSSSSSSFIVHRPRIFVHCFAGVSRSASVVIGYMMEKYHLTLAKAFEITFHQRSKIFPNAGFLKQLYLKEYELVDQFGVEDQQLKQLLQKDDNLINAIEIELGKELHTLIKLQDISRLPLQTDDYLDTMKYIHKTSYQEAKKIWEMRKFDKEKEIKKQQDD